MDVPYEKQFHCKDGTSIGSLEQLKAKLESISYQDFYHHVNTEKNDFASWVRHVLKDERLADDLQKVTSIVETVEIINDHMHPLPAIAPRHDTQSRIEENILSAPIFSSIDDKPHVIETVSTTTAGSPYEPGAVDFKVIEEKIGIFDDEIRTDEKAKAELFGAAEKERDQRPEIAPRKERRDDDETRLIVKDFIMGFIIGLIVGAIIGKLL